MIRRALASALNGRKRISIIGGRIAFCAALLGPVPFLRFTPGALPRAILLRPFRAHEWEAFA